MIECEDGKTRWEGIASASRAHLLLPPRLVHNRDEVGDLGKFSHLHVEATFAFLSNDLHRVEEVRLHLCLLRGDVCQEHQQHEDTHN